MSEQLKAAYTNYRWVKTTAFIALITCAALLFWLSGGFPPWAWRFLFQVLPQIPRLWQAQGGAILVPLLGLVLLSSALLIIWTAITISAVKVGVHWWHDFHEHQHFQMDIREAERMADDVTVSDLDDDEDDIDALPTRPVARQQAPQRSRDLSPAGRHQPMFVNAPLLEQRYFTNGYADHEEHVQAPPERVQASMQAASPAYPTPLVGREERVQPSMRAASPAYPARPTHDLSYTPGGRRSAAERRPQTERRVHIPPSASPSMRDQLRIVHPPVEERLYGDYDTLPGLPTLDVEVESEELEQAEGRAQGIAPTLDDEVESEELEQDLAPLLVEEEVESEELEQADRVEVAPYGRPAAENGRPSLDAEDVDRLDRQPSVELLRQVSPSPTGSAQRLVVGVGLDPGIVRRKAPNEDSLFAVQGTRITEHGAEPVGLFVVADGMGGHANGREASQVAIQSISDLVIPVLMRQTDSSQEENFADLLKDGVHRANLTIYQRNRRQAHMMGTTMTGALIADSTAYIVNVGDSRTYLYRKSEGLCPITRDHSIVARMVEDGIITPEDIYTHPKRNQIYRCLGERASVEVDTFVVPLRADDILLLCSDGLWEMVRDEDMRKIIASSVAHPSQMSSMLIQAALSRGGADNVSVVVVYVAVA